MSGEGVPAEGCPESATAHDMEYRRVGRSGLLLPAVSLGCWQQFGSGADRATQVLMVTKAFDLGITHIDLANNYGPPPGAAESRIGEILHAQLRGHRNELVIATKAGWDMWPGPYGNWGSRKHLIASSDESLYRLKLDYVDIFYSHRFDPVTPLEETMGALASIVQSGRALYAGLSNYGPGETLEALSLLRAMGIPCFIHQCRYNLLDREPEAGLLPLLGVEGVGCVAYSPLAQGLLSGKYRHGMPTGARAAQSEQMRTELLHQPNLRQVAALQEIADGRGQRLSQMALAWLLRDQRVSSVIIGASRVGHITEAVGALRMPDFSEDELAAIDRQRFITSGSAAQRALSNRSNPYPAETAPSP